MALTREACTQQLQSVATIRTDLEKLVRDLSEKEADIQTLLISARKTVGFLDVYREYLEQCIEGIDNDLAGATPIV